MLTVANVESPWLTITEAAERARCGKALLYREVAAGRLRAARVGGRRQILVRAEWVDQFSERFASPVEDCTRFARAR
jgi:excisionase family DNA binding protein